MSRWYIFLAKVCMVSLAANIVAEEQCRDVASTIGTYFMFGIIGNSPTSGQNVYIHIAPITDTTVAKVRIASPFNNLHQEFTVANYTIRTISYAHIQTESGKQFKGIEIYADVNISVAVFPAYTQNTEGFLVLPVSALSTRYVAASYHPSSGYYSEILVAGVESNTDVEINYTSNGKAKTEHIQLNQFETYQLLVAYDLSGALITSDKPVAVFSGSSYSNIPVGIGTVNYIVEQMIPQRYWSNQFIVPPIYPHNFFIVKIFVDYDNTEVHFYNSTHHFGSYMDRGSSQETLFGSEPIVILSTKPISVIQYCADNENMYGNPFMSTVQGISQYENVYKFVTEQYASTGSTVAITLKRNEMNGLSLGGKNISSWNAKIIPVARPMEEYVTIFVNISYSSLYRLQHTGGIPFGATLYGLLDTSYSYGYPLQLALSNTDCSAGHITGPTANPLYPHTDSSHGNNGNQGNIITGNGTWCFQCDNMSHLQYCDTVTRCQTEHESCYVQSFTRSNNVRLYRSGCMNKSACQGHGNQVQCQECCHGSFCNNIGCGDDGLPNFDARGPFCFDCEHQGEDGCQTVQMCRSDEACKIEKYQWGDGYHYIMGCIKRQGCTSKRDIHARHSPVCEHCCHSDFCNMNCTSAHVEQIIG